MFFSKKNKKDIRGFSIIEIIVSISIFLIYAVGIYGGIQFIFKVVYQSRIRIIETALLNEQIETIRNIPFSDIGIISGSPAGVLERVVTVNRNGIDFIITRSIRNVDDPYDGVVGGVPNDTAPADYKNITVEVICQSCAQFVPLEMDTIIGPKYLEGDPTHGALFVRVFDADVNPVVGATVHVVATSTNPQYDFEDTTDNDGYLRVVDLASGVQAFHITVSKDGYITDQTYVPSVDIPNPVKLPASVIEQDVTEISFEIDEASQFDIVTQDEHCIATAAVGINILGSKLMGTEPDVYKIDEDIITGVDGTYSLSNVLWDIYMFDPVGYDVLGTIPGQSISIVPGSITPVQVILGPNTVNSLLVHVTDSGNGQSLSDASVRIIGTGYDETKTTGVGHVRQTDWSGGDGQNLFVNDTQYFSDDGNIDTLNPVGDIKLKNILGVYSQEGVFESSIFDLGVEANVVQIIWEPLAQEQELGEDALLFQLAVSNTTTPATWDFLGPDGTNATYYDDEHLAIGDSSDGYRYIKYKAFLHSDITSSTPILSDVAISYTTECTPPGQAYFGNLTSEEYSVEVTRSGYQNLIGNVEVNGDVIFNLELVSE
jgi:hypothetical protein